MTYDEALAFWYSRVDYERKPAQPGELKLDRISDLLHRLGDPQDRLRIVHIAGSKGKGSTAAMFAAVARAAGLKAGLFTSPHLVDVSERIQVNDVPINRLELAGMLTEIRPTVETMECEGQAPTFFEIGTALGFLHFARSGVDLAVVEVGLGGRFDSTNVCRPLLSVITSISYDHTDILGDKLAQIAFEKCGIIKPRIPVVSGVTAPEAAEVVHQICGERGSPLLELGRDFHYSHEPGQVAADGSIRPASMQITADGDDWGLFKLRLLGAHQAANASLVIAGIHLLRQAGLRLSEPALHEGLASVSWPARMEVFPGPPLTVLDCAHNVASAKALVETLDESFPAGTRTLVFAASSDKDVHGMMEVLAPHFEHFVFTRHRATGRSLSADRLAEILRLVKPDAAVLTCDDPEPAVDAARKQHSSLIVITGSVFLAGNLRPYLMTS